MSRIRNLSLCLAVTLMASVALAAPHDPPRRDKERHARIEWTPRELRQLVERGQTYNLSATFKSSHELRDVQLRLTPSISRFATLDVTSFATVPANTPTTVHITLNVPPAPADSLLETRDSFAGTLQVRAAGRQIEKPLGMRFQVLRSRLGESTPGD